MSPLLVLAVAAGGGVGAAGRFLLDGLINTGRQFRLPVGTLTINITGSLLLGIIVGAATHLGAVPVAVLGTGVMGGYTTFSTASFETVRLARGGRINAAAVNGLGMLVVSVAAATAGILLGGLL
ncbi:fluoride efflux transporter CrcB [Curtobacterium pusillum]|uniref:Fluoride-specific ion channel FluC n=1 Tax=Curtobacterium pusillum TaxID=69373 RepID=A0ABX2M635_9MICO|nr:MULTISPECIES: CrcB family protein [Curtobacterium]MDT0234379.1 CrcB family protein [Curtobacterium sp. BRB10]NUU12335.1 CrcB family protein [Curtobacterium pusillum]PCN49613.1 CrcB family protein [Curtobacterium sp. 'Ferrero']WIE65565.1 CrcB family protein [Curtobacterium sp. MCLR17_036]GLK32379.1 putative fluoride ion transporter CrcB [Curtobacterium pusillum]